MKMWTFQVKKRPTFNYILFCQLLTIETKPPLLYTSKVQLFCGTHSLFKDPMSLSDYFLLMVEFCYRFSVRHRWQQPEGIPGGFGV